MGDQPAFDFSKLSFNFGGNQNGGGPSFNFQAAPGLLNAISSQLGGLVGQSSGYMESLPAAVRKRIRALKKLQEKHKAIDSEFEEEIRLLELKYHQRHHPLWQKRAAIISGTEEPTEEEAGPEEESEAPKIEEVKESESEDKNEPKGIPDFWLTALQNNTFFDEAITEKDIEVLKFLEDISFDYVSDEPWSFILTFRFAPDNPFLESAVMKKTYHIKKQDDGEPICETVDSTELVWKEGKNLLQGCKGGLADKNGSFFCFFTPPDIEEGSKPSLQVVDQMNVDFAMAVELKDKIIPGAIRWWTGEALLDEGEDAFGEDEEGEEGDDDEEDYHSDEDEDWTPPAGQSGTGQEAPAPECKQQ